MTASILPITSPAMAKTLAQIDATFGHAAVIKGFKLRVKWQLERGPDHPAVRARYGCRAAAMLCGYSIDDAIQLVERWYDAEPPGFSRIILAELHLMLRLGRRKLTDREFRESIARVLGETPPHTEDAA